MNHSKREADWFPAATADIDEEGAILSIHRAIVRQEWLATVQDGVAVMDDRLRHAG